MKITHENKVNTNIPNLLLMNILNNDNKINDIDGVIRNESIKNIHNNLDLKGIVSQNIVSHKVISQDISQKKSELLNIDSDLDDQYNNLSYLGHIKTFICVLFSGSSHIIDKNSNVSYDTYNTDATGHIGDIYDVSIKEVD